MGEANAKDRSNFWRWIDAHLNWSVQRDGVSSPQGEASAFVTGEVTCHPPGKRICVTYCEEKYFEKLAYFSRSKSVSPGTTKTPLIDHEKTTKTPSKNTHFSQNPP
jgi:hypothetical protein